MTDKELRKLNRSALLEMLVEQSRENDRYGLRLMNCSDCYLTAS